MDLNQEVIMNELIETIDKETCLSPEQTEKVVHMVVDYLERDLPLSEKTELDLRVGDIRREDISKDRQPFVIP